MDTWEKFSAFGDVAELWRVCDLLNDLGTIDAPTRADVSGLLGAKSHLIIQLRKQDDESQLIVDGVRPGLYQRTWIAKLFARLYVSLGNIAKNPQELRANLPRLELDLHKVLIAAHDVFDDHHRAALVAAATNEGAKKEKAARSQQSRTAVANRSDQKTRAAFMNWARESINAGSTANTIDEVMALSGFKWEWGKEVEKATIKKWAKAAGFKFKGGRPSKKKGV